jgi:hypothetical protein
VGTDNLRGGRQPQWTPNLSGHPPRLAGPVRAMEDAWWIGRGVDPALTCPRPRGPPGGGGHRTPRRRPPDTHRGGGHRTPTVRRRPPDTHRHRGDGHGTPHRGEGRPSGRSPPPLTHAVTVGDLGVVWVRTSTVHAMPGQRRTAAGWVSRRPGGRCLAGRGCPAGRDSGAAALSDCVNGVCPSSSLSITGPAHHLPSAGPHPRADAILTAVQRPHRTRPVCVHGRDMSMAATPPGRGPQPGSLPAPRPPTRAGPTLAGLPARG